MPASSRFLKAYLKKIETVSAPRKAPQKAVAANQLGIAVSAFKGQRRWRREKSLPSFRLSRSGL